MADLSAVLRKTIDGLPRATPSMRAKVYEKARAAISRQIDTANPPLADEVVTARRHALESAITQTEAYYSAIDAGGDAPAPQPVRDEALAPPPPRSEPPRAPAPQDEIPAPRAAPPVQAAPPTPPRATPRPPERERVEPSIGDQRAPSPSPVGRTERSLPPVVPVGIEPRDLPDPVEAPFPTSRPAVRERRDTSRLEPPRIGSTEPDVGLDEGAIPAADVRAPRQPNGARRAKKSSGSRSPVLVGLAVILFAGAATAAYVYLDDIRSALNISGSSTVASTDTPAATDEAGTDEPDAAEGEEGAEGATAPAGETPAATAAPKRRFTQRLLPDGTEVDEGPAPVVANAFDEGTNVAAASPPTAETQPSAMSPTPGAAGTTAPAADAAPAATPPAQTAAVQPTQPGSATAPAVAQKAVFYEERSETEAGTQRAGNVVWSVVNEPPADGQPAEPAIRAVADVPEENIKLTLTIRRNTDATLPASHVIELMFDTPADFPGGSIANVQRLALKPTEQARGEPLTGVAGKISDGFFIIALNNLSEAVTANLDLLGREQWIDIPIAYATGRRALMSIEKGIPGDRVFKQAMDAWAGKT
ncbi:MULTISPECIES: hypothetical protein [unclassified Aureimonas]|uniref:hypothetical protein n=1 Tax=unclassified Aureimonas TaxID=2615206 RepID=UPI0006F226D5|nr:MULTISPECIES: hypothetical protein [unclassified Aureimonas]KQT55172.1 hypothetical protein ASG62_09995 [Aureimonas sp. Leaf427]KQT70961.1 hypothetical protein ASG54_20380 [Aureimonas sp. Leaf460]